MENKVLREEFQIALKSVQDKLFRNRKVISAMLLGSMSHDKIWEWSDLQVLCIVDDSYKGPRDYNLLEYGVQVLVNIRKRNEFLTYLQNTNISDYYYCAVYKGEVLFTKDEMLTETIKEYFHIGSREREVEMLLGFSSAIYYLNKTEKNLKIKKNLNNAIYFAMQIADTIAWIEVAKQSEIPEREIIEQARKHAPDIFEKIYDPLVDSKITEKIVSDVIDATHKYLEDNTQEVYRPILEYLKVHKNLSDFSLKTHEHGFGINYDWLIRMGITTLYEEPIKIDGQTDLYYKSEHKLKEC